ncbi:hypothetical protein EST38_g168 [Candolleomyces aberdarensis]|uniref:Actin-like ATPase domain-containing protein n=1 Tax=Candolleomyces aberdarensis TaxID=2316362 RepID=A0A4Q2E060_9AGAR|nr:hypothetical protein EST38_g168 [Candolleomyces aberdarensis]
MLHIRPKPGSLPAAYGTQKITPLPAGKRVVQVLADFLQYLHECAQAYIEGADLNGRELWKSVASEIDYVISHPNGWKDYQRSQILDAAVIAGLIPDTTDRHRVSFVTEGEAGLYFAIDIGFSASAMQAGDGVVVVEAGEETIDVSAYRHKVSGTNTTIGTFEEIAAPQCHLYGSVYVSMRVRLFLMDYLKNSVYCDDLDHMVRCFDKSTKVRFRSDKEAQYINFGSTRDNDAACNIRFGKLKLDGTDVAAFFEPSVKCIIDSVHAQIRNGHCPIKYVVLVGGFSASDWLFDKVNEVLDREGIKVMRPDSLPWNLDFALISSGSDGAISFYLSDLARTRALNVARGSTMNEEREKENWDREISRMKESMDLELKAVREELDVKRKECSDARDAELKATEREKETSRVKERLGLELKAVREGLDVELKECADARNAELRARERERETSRVKESMDLELKVVREELDVKRKECSDARNALEKARKPEPRNVDDALRKSREEVQSLAAENKKLSDEVSRLKDSLALSRKESTARRLREEQLVRSPVSSSSPTSLLNLQSVILSGGAVHNSGMKDSISVDKATELVQNLNLQIVETASALVENLAWARWGNPADADAGLTPTASLNSTQTQEAKWLLGGEELTLLLGFVPAPESSAEGSTKDSNPRLRTLLQIGLTTWNWTQALISSLSSILSFLGLTYTRPTTLAQELQPLLTAIRSVREGLGESVVSKELEVVTITPGTTDGET